MRAPMAENGKAAGSGPALRVSDAESGSSLLEFLSGRLINESKTALRRLAANGLVAVNGRKSTPGRRIFRLLGTGHPSRTRHGRRADV